MDLEPLVFVHESSNMNWVDCLQLPNKSIINTRQSIRLRPTAPFWLGCITAAPCLDRLFDFCLAANGNVFDVR